MTICVHGNVESLCSACTHGEIRIVEQGAFAMPKPRGWLVAVVSKSSGACRSTSRRISTRVEAERVAADWNTVYSDLLVAEVWPLYNVPDIQQFALESVKLFAREFQDD